MFRKHLKTYHVKSKYGTRCQVNFYQCEKCCYLTTSPVKLFRHLITHSTRITAKSSVIPVSNLFTVYYNNLKENFVLNQYILFMVEPRKYYTRKKKE